jgi:hypothetical protein
MTRRPSVAFLLTSLAVACGPSGPDPTEIRACEAAADEYLAVCAGDSRSCGVRAFRSACADGDAAAIRATYECLLANVRGGGVCATFFDLATTETRACVWRGIGEPSAGASAAQAAYCARCPAESVCTSPRDELNPEPWEYFGAETNAAIEGCIETATDCESARYECWRLTPLAVCLP